ncbi:MAG: hypothetical protein AAF944_25200 [Bacteroidota bacterium]
MENIYWLSAGHPTAKYSVSIVAIKHLKSLRKALGDPVTFKTFEDPNPLGVEMPEVL